ncbi:uncharacterized protein BYT42DRAFT_613560 [Radiomyces spectabilis]|uniref:uncharacterized protein n=1 Tax=Radiomyces spectabilis TaxID=64574 RepID=UPI002220D134|nr:uncharacterized protein BYT42DRAFT_613560 [Radiomyces spectabilis]KAI8379232.1 hypothetical protein BYT42DRAFT_613560 [Radiomyces spectabilis]
MYTPTKRIYAPNDPFFQEGNIALRAIWLERDAAESGNDADMVREEADRLAQNYIQPPIYCEMATCTTRGESMAFPSVAAYQLHYEATHRHVCTVCNKHFPGALWLDLHFNECHDVFKQMQKEKGEKIYACFVEGCTKLFSTPKMRRLHLVDKHRYPRYFPFDLPWTGTKTAKPRRSQRSQSHFQVPKPNPSDGSTTMYLLAVANPVYKGHLHLTSDLPIPP